MAQAAARRGGSRPAGQPARAGRGRVPTWRWALEFRDWLRADVQASRRSTQELKLELSRRFAADETGFAYGEAKEPWMDAAVPRRVEAYRGGQTS